MVCRDEVVDWFHKLNGAGRLDVMCTLLDFCLPFELRFFGTYMENLGRKDFHQLRDADYRANSFLQHQQSRLAHSDRTALFNLLMDHATLSASQLSSPSGAPAPGKGHPPSTDEVDAFSTTSLKNGLESVLMNGERPPEGKEVNGVSSCGESVEKGGDKTVLEDEVLRRRLILFLSLLTATNRDCANAYFKILSEVLPLLDETGWLDSIEEMMLEEMAVLYTIAGNHPAFTFDQRKKLNDVGLIFRERQSAKQQQPVSHTTTKPTPPPAPPMMMTTATVTTTGTSQPQQLYPIHINEQQHYYLGPQQIPISMWQRAPTNNPGGAYTSDDLARLQAQYAFHTFPYTTSLPAAVFMAPQSHHPIAFPVQNRTPTNNSNNPLSTPSLLHEYRQQNYPQMIPTIHAHNLGIHAAAAASAAGGLSVLPAQFSQQQQQQQPKSHHHNNDVIITPNGLPPTTTVTSVNQTDGNDSEELSWNSPELSPPFQSPSQSLTPSRSQSPITNKPLIQVQQQQQIQQQQQQQQQQLQQQQQQQQGPRQNYLPQVVSYTSQSSSEMGPPRSPPPPARPLKSNPNSPGGAIHTNGIKSGRSIKSNNSSNSSSNVPLSSSATTSTSTLNSTPAFSTSTIQQQQQHQASSHQPVKSATYTSRNDRRHNNHVGNGRNKYNNNASSASSSSSSSSSSTSSSSKNNPSSSAPPTPTEYTHHYRSPFSVSQYPTTNSKAKGPLNEVLLPLSTTKADKVQVPPPFSSSSNNNSAAKGPPAIPTPTPTLAPAEPLLSMPPPQALLNHMSIISPVATTAATPNTVLPFAVPLPLVVPPTVPQQLQQQQQILPNSQVLVEVGGDTAGASQFVHLEDMNIGLNARPKMSCYNCGAQTHYGPECKENTLEEMTKYAYRINFNPDGGDSKDSE